MISRIFCADKRNLYFHDLLKKQDISYSKISDQVNGKLRVYLTDSNTAEITRTTY